ncbi:unnamed protein product, partial [Urochloa humidicola]
QVCGADDQLVTHAVSSRHPPSFRRVAPLTDQPRVSRRGARKVFGGRPPLFVRLPGGSVSLVSAAAVGVGFRRRDAPAESMPATTARRSWTWACGCCVGRRNKGGGAGGVEAGASGRAEEGGEAWSLFIDLPVLEAATDGFSDDNLLGRGGFGPVYKGVMPDGQQIAVKKLSLGSRQGVREFLNEVRLLLKVQHRNLVSLLGCCASSGHKMLVYPYFPNGSLDHILFNRKRCVELDWPKRYQIVIGLARGLLYLHEESPVKIIHRDIKASNVLLDDQLNPKIADFGMARLFLEDASHVNTFRISGT